MSKLKKIREELNLTQNELCDKSGISIRTIQRIESGNEPKGQTLKILAKTLGIKEIDLLAKKESPNDINTTLMKIINLSSLPFIIIPAATIIAPLLIMFAKKQYTPMAKQIVSIQILWLISSVIIFMLSALMTKWFSIDKNVIPIVMILLVVSNVFIILRNSAEIDRKGKLFFKLNFSLI